MTTLGNNLERMRVACGLSRPQLAKKAGVSASLITRVENGVQELVDDATLKKLADALECYDPSDLTGRKPAAAPAPDGEVVTLMAPFELRADNYRKTFPVESLEEMARSIQEHGVLQPLRARRKPGGALVHATIIMGERRWRGAILGIERGWLPADFRLPVILCYVSAKDAALQQLVENLQREEVPPLEEAERFIELTTGEGAITVQALANAIGKTDRYIQQRTALVRRGAPEVKQALASGKINLKTARVLIQAAPDQQKKLLKEVLEQPLTSRVNPERLRERITGGHIPFSRAIFDPATYTGDVYVNEETGAKYFTDKPLFQKLQAAAAVAKAEDLKATWAWVEIYETHSTWWRKDYTEAAATDPRAGCIVHYEPEQSKVTVHEALVPVEHEDPVPDVARIKAEVAQVEAHAQLHQEQDREAAAFKMALIAKLLADPGMVMRLWLLDELRADDYGKVFLGSFWRGLPSDLFQPGKSMAALGTFVEPFNSHDTQRCMRRRENEAAVWRLLFERPASDIRLTVEAHMAQRINIHRGYIHPLLIPLARRYGLVIPAFLLPESERGQHDLEDAVNAAPPALEEPNPVQGEADREEVAEAPLPPCKVVIGAPGLLPQDLLDRLAEALPRAPGYGLIGLTIADTETSESAFLLKASMEPVIYELLSFNCGFGPVDVAECDADELGDWVETWLANPECWATPPHLADAAE